MPRQAIISRRRRRVWAPTPKDTDLLGRSARQLFRASATRISRPAVAGCLEQYRYVTEVERACKLIRGDLLVLLIDRHGLRAIDIARETGERPGDISEMYAVAVTFPRRTRPGDACYNHLLLATRMVRKFPGLGMTPCAALAEIQRAGLSQHRDVTRHFSTLSRCAGSKSRRQLLEHGSVREVINRAHRLRFQELLSAFRDRSIQILAIDPPYVYNRETYGARSARSRTSDSDDPVSAVEVVVDVLRDWQQKLAAGGVVLLWQPWQGLLPPISEAIATYRWAVVGPIVWDKARPQPGNFVSPYGTQGELLWVLHRPGDVLHNHDGSSRDMILRVPPVSAPHLAHRQLHAYEKPQALCEILVRKHSAPGDLVFDACGCTGSMSVAAINCGRRWVYAESNPENFALGQQRTTTRLADVTVATS